MSPSPTDRRQPVERQPVDALIARIAEQLRGSEAPAHSPVATWQALAQSGLLAAAVPVEHGGLGGSPQQIMPIMRELGRHLICEPLIPTAVMAVKLLQEAGTPAQQATLLPGIASGMLKFAFALSESHRYRRTPVHTTAYRAEDGDGYRISGYKTGVRHASCADKLIVTACTRDAEGRSGITVFMVDSDASGLHRTDYRTPDGQPASDLSFDGVWVPSSEIIGGLHQGLPAVERAYCHGTAAYAAETLGTMDALIELIEKRLYRSISAGCPAMRLSAAFERLSKMKRARDRSLTLLKALKAHLTELPATHPATIPECTTLSSEARLVASHAMYLQGVQGLADGLPIRAYFKRLMASDLDLALGQELHGAQYRRGGGARAVLRANGVEYVA